MGKLVVALLDEEERYADMLAAYVRNSEYKDKVIFKGFSRTEAVNQHLEQSGTIHILLADPILLAGLDKEPDVDFTAYLSQNLLRTESLTMPIIFKYQPLNQLFAKLLALYNEQGFSIRSAGSRLGNTSVISVYSAVGGCGKTTVSANLAKLLAYRGQRVFFLSLESLAAVPFHPLDSESQSFSKLLYYAKAAPAQLSAKLPSLIRLDSGTKIKYFEPLTQLRELLHIQSADTEAIIGALLKTDEYDFIVIDMESGYEERLFPALAMSDHVLWLMSDDLHSMQKTALLYRELLDKPGEPSLSKEKVNFWLNKFTGSIQNRFQSEGIDISGYLPYIPHWKSVQSVDVLLNEPTFQDELLRLFQACLGKEAVMVGG